MEKSKRGSLHVKKIKCAKVKRKIIMYMKKIILIIQFYFNQNIQNFWSQIKEFKIKKNLRGM